MKPENAMWINLGCSDRKLPGFLNVDIRPESGADIIDDVTKLESIKDESVDLIYACHLAEHIPRKEVIPTFKLWYSKLRLGGILRLAVPDIDAVCKLYMETRDLTPLYTSLWGSQRHEFDFHYHGWNSNTLISDLMYAGFRSAYLWDWRTTYPHYMPECDDYAKAYLPHMDFENGTHISLNVEAVK
jgi:hypothetical protein